MPTSTSLWSDEELEATVDTYADILARMNRGEQVTKMEHYRILAQRFQREPSAYRRRFYNISHVLIDLGVAHMPYMAPMAHMGTRVETTIRQYILRNNLFTIAGPLERSVALSVPRIRPVGNPRPPRRQVLVEQAVRDAAVVSWVLAEAAGYCECCGLPAPFLREDGTSYLEVHHVKWLAQGGSDTVSNAVALCPNCHRQLHHGVDAARLLAQLVERVARLVEE